MAGFGFDGDVVTRHHRSRTSPFGRVLPTLRMAYVEPILRSSLSYRFPRITVQIADAGAEECLIGTSVFVFNLPRYALGLPFAPKAQDDDGWLDLVVFRDPGPFRALYYLWQVVCGNHLQHPGVFHRLVKKVIVTAEGTVPVQLDGDPAGFLMPEDRGGENCRGKSGHDRTTESADEDPPAAAIQSAAQWTVEALPAALRVIAPPDRRGLRRRLALVKNRLVS
jgi:diacylglycerol kinase family enzyme